MVISLDDEVAPYEPFGRSIVQFVPNHKSDKPPNNDNEHCELLSMIRSLHNDFTTSELESTKELFNMMNNISITNENNQREFWKLRKSIKGEEELYVNENVLICSHCPASISTNSVLEKTYSFSEKILDATWCKFILNDNLSGIATQDLSNLMFKSGEIDPSSGKNQYPKFLLSSPIINNDHTTSRYQNEYNFYKSLKILKALCVLDKYSINIITEGGDYHRKTLQFEINKMVSTNFGLLMERSCETSELKVQTNSKSYPSLFSLSNVLNEITPVLMVSTSNSKHISNRPYIGYLTPKDRLTLIDFIIDKNIAIFHCSKTGMHHIYYMRPINNFELDWIRLDMQGYNDISMDIDNNCVSLNITPTPNSVNISTPTINMDGVKKQCRLSSPIHTSSPMTRSMSNNFLPNFPLPNNRQSPITSSMTASSINIANVQSPHNVSQPLSNFAFEMSNRRVSSPLTIMSPLTSGRIDSPASPNMSRLTFSQTASGKLKEKDRSHLSSSQSPSLSKTSRYCCDSLTPSMLRRNQLDLCSHLQICSEPIIPDFCLEFVWSENGVQPVTGINVAATKTFVTCNFLGQNYLCLLVKGGAITSSFGSSELSQLKLIKFDHVIDDYESNEIATNNSNVHQARYIFSTVKTINVKDAEPIDSLNMILVLDEANSLVLYSGTHKVSIVHFQANIAIHNEWSKHFNTETLTPNYRKTVAVNFELDFADILSEHTPKMGKVISSSPLIRDTGTDGSLQFSIQQYPSFGTIVSLRDSVENRITFQTAEGKTYRLAFPNISSTFLVDKCLAALRQIFSKEDALYFLTTWYTFRNSTNKDENISEIILFKLCLLSTIGYEIDSIKDDYLSKNVIAPVVSTSTPSSNRKARSVIVRSPSFIGHSETLEKEVTKKMKIENDHGTDDDWIDLIRNSENLYGLDRTTLLNEYQQNCNRRKTRSASKKNISLQLETNTKGKYEYRFDSPGVLFSQTPNILFALHLIYEDFKPIQMNWPLCKSLADILYLLSVDLDLPQYQDYYVRDFPSICVEIMADKARYSTENRAKLIYPTYFRHSPPSIYGSIYSFLKKCPKNQQSIEPFPYICSSGSVTKPLTPLGGDIITPNLFNLIMLYSNMNQNELIEPHHVLQCIGNNLLLNVNNTSSNININKYKQMMKLYKNKNLIHKQDSLEKMLFLMSSFGITQYYLNHLPFGLSLPLWDIIAYHRHNPKNDWCSSIYSLIDRTDLFSLEQNDRTNLPEMHQNTDQGCELDFMVDDDDRELAYLDHSVLHLLFPNDQRLQEAYNMLTSSSPLLVTIQQAAGVSDHDFIEEQEKFLYGLCVRSMALPLGRGMVTLGSYTPVVAERFSIPPLCLKGKVPPRNTNVDLTHIDVPPNMNVWPLFHNGVAAGLRISSHYNKMIDSSWILYNKPTNNMSPDEHYVHAGFLFALGLNGILENLSIMEMHDYLAKGNDLTKVAILLGITACKRGTMDPNAHVLLGIHLEGLLPSSSTELDVSPIVKVAAVLGVGLLFQGTGQSYIAEVMLNEIGRPPGPEMEHYIDRESYALSAGLAFGLVTLGRGNEMFGMTSSEGISIPDQLNHYMLGVHKKQSVLQREKNKTPSYHIREGDSINADVTSPGATLALGMMFFNTNNKAIAQWLNVPDTQNLLEMVRPDFIMLRVLAQNLVMWSEIKPTSKWIESHIPPIIYNNAFQKAPQPECLANERMAESVDYETMSQSYCNIIAGACFALALRYAGSADPDAFDVVRMYTSKLITITHKGSADKVEQAGRSTIESCLNVLIVSCSIIMAGTGNVEVMRMCRLLRSRINQCHVLYGSFMALHMALGLLFLGGCRLTLNSSPESIAALLCAFFPKYPIHTCDNRYHLQAFRHLYVLATEPRLLVPRCIDTGSAVNAKIRYRFRNSVESIEKLAPFILPNLNNLDSVQLVDENYWSISFESNINFNKLQNCLQNNGNLYIKRKVKSLSYHKQFIYSLPEDFDDEPKKFNSKLKQKRSLFHKSEKKSFTLFDFTNHLARPIPKLKYIESTRFRLEKMINESIDKEALKSYLNGQPLNDLIDDSLIEAIVYYHIDCQNRGENATKNMYRSADRRIFNLINVDE
ncbi:Anaphase-promoting complex subunit 1 [Blomia tropicalis]|nr:Anaphase-promoting complex subunit 1 [Blomia tropicalis]